MSHAKREHQPTGWRLGTWCSNCADPEPNGTLFERQTANFVNWLVENGLPANRAEAALMRLRLLEPGALDLGPDWVGKPDANGDIPCSRLAPKRCMWVEGHYGGCATP